MPLDTLIPLTLDTAKQAAVAGANAFMDDPTTYYLIPDPSKCPNLKYAFEYYLRLSVLGHDEAFITSPRCEGMAVWSPSTSRGSPFNVLRAGWPWLPLRCGWAYLIRDARMEHRYEKLRDELAPKPHMYLALLAVDPAYQGQGFATRLMKPMLARLDREKMSAYVETQNLKNAAMYRHFGFTLLREDAYPGTGFSLYLMLRQPVLTHSASDNLP
jgi:ribosomal protein S18 acetylase RimI-like enzyme